MNFRIKNPQERMKQYTVRVQCTSGFCLQKPESYSTRKPLRLLQYKRDRLVFYAEIQIIFGTV